MDTREDLSTNMTELQMREPAGIDTFGRASDSAQTHTQKTQKQGKKRGRKESVDMRRLAVTDPANTRTCLYPPCSALFTPPNGRCKSRALYCCQRCRLAQFAYLQPRVPREEWELLQRIKKGEVRVVDAQSVCADGGK